MYIIHALSVRDLNPRCHQPCHKYDMNFSVHNQHTQSVPGIVRQRGRGEPDLVMLHAFRAVALMFDRASYVTEFRHTPRLGNRHKDSDIYFCGFVDERVGVLWGEIACFTLLIKDTRIFIRFRRAAESWLSKEGSAAAT